MIWDKTPSPYQLHLPSSSPPRHTQTYTTPSQNIPWYTLRLWVLCEASLKFDFKDLQGLCQKSVRVSNLCWINDQTHKGCLWFRFSERGLVLARLVPPTQPRSGNLAASEMFHILLPYSPNKRLRSRCLTLMLTLRYNSYIVFHLILAPC